MQAAGLPVAGETADEKPSVLIAEYERKLQRRGSSVVHVRKTIQRVTTMLAKAKRLVEVTPATVRQALDRLESRKATAWRSRTNAWCRFKTPRSASAGRTTPTGAARGS